MKLFRFLPLIALAIFVISIFYPFFLRGQLPIPADTIVGLYHPWRDIHPRDVPFKNFLITDPVRQQYPWRELAIDQLKNGQWPKWNPYSFAGIPLAANIQTAAFYPLNFLYWLLPFSLAWSWQIVLQVIFGGLFMWAYLRNLKLRSEAVALGTIAWAGSGFFVAWLEWNTLVQVAIWLPLLLLSLEKRWWPIFSLSLAASFLAGHLQIFFYVAVFVAAYAIAKRKVSLPLFLATIATVALTGVQWQPMIDLFSAGQRTVALTDWQKPEWFLPWQNLAMFLAPDFFGNPATGNYFGLWNYGEFISYVGVIPLFFALRASSRKFAFWWIALGVTLLFALPNPVSQLPFRLQLPFLASAQPTRLLVLVDFILAVLAAIGLDVYLNQKQKTFRPAIPITGVFVALWFIAWQLHLTVSLRNLVLPTTLILLTMAIIRFQKVAIFAILAATIFDLARFAGKFESFSDTSFLFPETKVTRFLEDQAKSETFRVAALDDRIFPPNFSTHYRLQMVSGYDSLVLSNYVSFVRSGSRITVPKDLDLLKTLNVKYVLSFDDLDPKSFTLIMQEGQTKLWQAKIFAPRVSLSAGKAVIKSYDSNEIEVMTSASAAAELVLRDDWYPAWRAAIDNLPVTILPFENIFRKVSVPAGEHTVTFKI